MTADLPGANTRAVEEGIVRDFRTNLSYSAYLHLDELLAAQQPRSAPVHHDELLFIVQHQTSELWLKLLLHELRSACDDLAADDARARAEEARPRQAHPEDADRAVVGAGHAHPGRVRRVPRRAGLVVGLPVGAVPGGRVPPRQQERRHAAAVRARRARRWPSSRELLERPSVYDEFLRLLARRGHPVPRELLERDVRRAHVFCPELVDVLTHIYDDTEHYWDVYETCEELVDIEENFQLWRFRHLKTVQRMIGGKTGTGGSSGVPFLRRALELTFFPELYAVRTTIGS